MAPPGGKRAFPICLDVTASAAKRTFTPQWQGSHHAACIRARDFNLDFSLIASTRAALALSRDFRQGERPYWIVVQAAEAGSP
jgi:hypothetical protein